MSQSFSKFLINTITDWLIAFFAVSLLLWFVLTQPVLDLFNDPVEQLVETQELKKHVELLTQGYAPRTLNYDNLNNTAEYIYSELSNVGIPEYQYIETISQQYRNVFLQLGPDTQEVYVIGAHYDAKDDSIDSEGNASGIATLIELARQLAKNNEKLDIGVILIAYPISMNQSDNMVDTGSFFHAKSLKEKNKSVRLMISLDSVGQFVENTRSDSQSFDFRKIVKAEKENSINLIGRFKDFKTIRTLKKRFNHTSQLSLQSQNFLENHNENISGDHINYWRQGFPAVLISDVIRYENTTDTQGETELMDRLDYDKMANLATGLFQVIIQTQAGESDKTQLAQRARNKKPKPLFN